MAEASTVASVTVGCWGAMCGGGTRIRSGCVGRGATCGAESGLGAGGVGGVLFEARRSEVVEPRRAEREGGDVRIGDGAGAADAANSLRAAKR